MTECGSERTFARDPLPVSHMLEMFSGPKFCPKLIFLFLIFSAGWIDENILMLKFFRFTVALLYPLLVKNLHVSHEKY